MDPALERLVQPVQQSDGSFLPCADRGTFRGVAGKCQADNIAFAKLVNQFGGVIAPTAMHSGRTTGYGGFHVGLEGAFTSIDSGAAYWKDGTRGPVDPSTKQFSVRNQSPSSTLGLYALKVRKGFPFGLEITAQLGFIGQTTMFVGGADIRMSLFEGFRRGPLGVLPDVAAGGGVRTLTGTPQMNITVASFDAQISKPFPIADSSIFIPYAGYQHLFIFGDSGLIDTTPNTDALGACGFSGTNQPGNADTKKRLTPGQPASQYYDGQPVCAAAGTPLDFNNNIVFDNVRVTRGRLVLGASFRFESVFLGGQFATDLFAPDSMGGRDNKTKLAGVPKQTTLAFEVGAHFLPRVAKVVRPWMAVGVVRPAVLVGAAWVGLGGCAGRPAPSRAPEAVGGSSSAEAPPTPQSFPLAAWTVAPERVAVVPVGKPFPSQGHTRGRWVVTVSSTDAALLGGLADLPRGFVVCGAHADAAGASLLCCMRKESVTPGDWGYGVGTAYGQPFDRAGRLQDCAGCHVTAPRDGLFGDPRLAVGGTRRRVLVARGRASSGTRG